MNSLETENKFLKEAIKIYMESCEEKEEIINKAIAYINNIKEQWNNKSVPERNLYMFETYLNGIQILAYLLDILEGKK